MTRTRRMAGKDLRVLWASPVSYVVAAAFHVALGLLYVTQLEQRRQAVIQPMFPLAGFLLLLTVPVLTMRAFSEEAKTGTLDVLLAARVPSGVLVVGKWLAAWITALVVVAPSCVFVVLLNVWGSPEAGPIEAGYVGLIVLCALLTGVGVLASSLTTSQPIAAMLSLIVALLLWFAHVGSDAVATGALLARFSISERLRTFAGGALDTGDVGFFVVMTMATLVVAGGVLRARRLR